MDQPLTGSEPRMDRVINVPCKTCGSEMIWSPDKKMLECKHCGATRVIETDNDLIVEQPFSETISLQGLPQGLGTEAKVFHCKGCGADTAVPPSKVEFICPFCGSVNVNPGAHEMQTIRPQGIIPFIISQQAGEDKFKKWIGTGWFRPSALKRLATLHKLHGVYVPFWTYDAETSSSWTAMSGYYYYTTETYTENGQVRTRQVKHTRWVPSSGYYEHDFDDVLVVGSKGVTQNSVERIYPYELNKVVNYDTQFILGLSSEVYQVDVQEGWRVADNIMDDYIRDQCRRMVPGDTHRDLNVNTRKSNVHFKHLLLPLWIAAYQFRGKTYQFLINGQTGKIAGQKPVSIGKVLLAIGVVVGIGVGLYFLFRK